MAGNRPDTGDVHVNALLTDVSVAYRNQQTDFIAAKVFPIVSVQKQSDLIAKYTASDWLRDEMALRAPGTEAAEAGWGIDNTTNYFCKGFALKKSIPDEVRANVDAPYDMDRDAVQFLTDKALIKLEREFATIANSTNWTTTTAVSVKWSDYANSDPINDIFGGKRTVHQLIGMTPNTLVLGEIVMDKLRIHPDFVELVKYTTTNNVPTEAQIAKVLGLDNLFICKAIYESAVEGAVSSIAAIWDDDALLVFVPANASLMTPSAGYTFNWKPQVGGGLQYIRRWRSDAKTADFIEVRSYFDVKLLTADAGRIWQDCVDA